MDKVLILEALRNYKQLASRNQFAKLLGVTAQTLNNWYNRGTYDLERLIVTFPEVSPLWIISGEGEMLLKSASNTAVLNGDNNIQTVGAANKVTFADKQNDKHKQNDDFVYIAKKSLENQEKTLAILNTLVTNLINTKEK